MTYEEITTKTVALLMMAKYDNGEDDWAVTTGKVTRIGSDLFFVPCGKTEGFPIPDDALERLKATTMETRGILLGADLVLPVTVGPTPDGAQDFLKTGLRWPNSQNDKEPTDAAAANLGQLAHRAAQEMK